MESNLPLPRPNSPQRTRRTQRADGFHDRFPISHRGHRAARKAWRVGNRHNCRGPSQEWTTQPPGSAPAHFHRSLGRCPRDDDHAGTPGSLLPTLYSLLSTLYSLLPTLYSLLPTPYSLLPTLYSLLPTPYSLLPAFHRPITTPVPIDPRISRASAVRRAGLLISSQRRSSRGRGGGRNSCTSR